MDWQAMMTAAKATGVPVMLIGGPPPGGPEPGAPGSAAFTALRDEASKWREEAQRWQAAHTDAHAALQQARAAAPANGTGGADAARAQHLEMRLNKVDADFRGVVAERDAAKAKASELEGLIGQLRSQAATTAPGANAAPVEKTIEDYPIDVLGLEASVFKIVQKAAGEVKTVNELWAAFRAGKIKPKTKDTPDGHFTQPQVIDIFNRLAGRVPSAHRPENGSTGPAPGGQAATGVPAGWADRSWLARIESARKKEARAGEVRVELDTIKAELEKVRGQPLTPDTAEQITALTGKMHDADKLLGLYEGQVLALLFACGFEPKVAKTVDAALKDAGLVHLMTTVPAGVGA
jgi:hypothetical protein